MKVGIVSESEAALIRSFWLETAKRELLAWAIVAGVAFALFYGAVDAQTGLCLLGFSLLLFSRIAVWLAVPLVPLVGLFNNGLACQILWLATAAVLLRLPWTFVFFVVLSKILKRDTLRTLPYQEYLQTQAWQALRQRKLEEAGNRCQLCNQGGELHLHHRSYERLGHEPLNDLTVLCRSCHERFHGLKEETHAA